MSDRILLTEKQWHSINAKFDPRVDSDKRDFKVDMTRVRTWKGQAFTVIETFYYEADGEGSFKIDEVTYLFIGDKSLIETASK